MHAKNVPDVENDVKFTPLENNNQAPNTKSMFSGFGAVLPSYFSSEWSFAQFKLTDTEDVKSAILGDLLIVATKEGNYYLA